MISSDNAPSGDLNAMPSKYPPSATKSGTMTTLSNGESTTAIDFTASNSVYSDSPGSGYDFVDTTRLVEPQVATTFNLYAADSAEISDCTYSLSLRYGGGPWDEISGVKPAADFSATGTTAKTTSDEIATVEKTAPASVEDSSVEGPDGRDSPDVIAKLDDVSTRGGDNGIPAPPSDPTLTQTQPGTEPGAVAPDGSTVDGSVSSGHKSKVLAQRFTATFPSPGRYNVELTCTMSDSSTRTLSDSVDA